MVTRDFAEGCVDASNGTAFLIARCDGVARRFWADVSEAVNFTGADFLRHRTMD